MTQTFSMKVIARMESDFPEKFGIPRQSGLVETLKGRIVFEKEFRSLDAVKGLEGFSHIWLLWAFSENVREDWSPTVRPPRLGGNTRMGVFATRSPFRPNPIGLSCVKLDKVETSPGQGPVLWVSGADLMDGTPILDIKPYLPHVDSHPLGTGGFGEQFKDYGLQVQIPEEVRRQIPQEKLESLEGVLAQDPRPSYQNDPSRIYGMSFGEFQIRFQVQDKVLTVREAKKLQGKAGEQEIRKEQI